MTDDLTNSTVPSPRGGIAAGHSHPGYTAAASGMLNLSVEHRAEGVVVVRLGGEVDMFTAPLLRSALRELINRAVSTIVLDVAEVGFLGCRGLATLIDLREAARRSGVRMLLACPRRPVRRLLAASGQDRVFTSFPTVAQAVLVSETPSAAPATD